MLSDIISMVSLCYLYVISMLSICYLYVISMLSLYYLYVISMLALDLIFTESSICSRELLWYLQSSRDRYSSNTRKYPIVCHSINRTFDTELWSELCASPG